MRFFIVIAMLIFMAACQSDEARLRELSECYVIETCALSPAELAEFLELRSQGHDHD